jgi:hypothetical protein
MDNNIFLKEFEYFKNHPKEYKHRHSGLGFLVSIFFIVVYVVIFCVQNSTSDQDLKDFLSVVSPYYILVGFITSISYFVYISIINKRVNKFDRMKYVGLVSELFGDIKHVAIKEYTEQLRADLSYTGAISGETAYKIHSRMSYEAMIDRTKNQSIASMALDELEKAHGFRPID